MKESNPPRKGRNLATGSAGWDNDLVLGAGLEPAMCANLAPMPAYKTGVLPTKLPEQK